MMAVYRCAISPWSNWRCKQTRWKMPSIGRTVQSGGPRSGCVSVMSERARRHLLFA
jgi:hypothetical protein